ncbi:momilactone A synthase-like [Cryptomeria japonica]|uniref:momilactone A synthase-like n=1 Tax=Cryptomeria japonica TaxID=3369 RepID=UPI0027DA7140|nr:momilactone A synthase-like [Cryptomeria japonica]
MDIREMYLRGGISMRKFLSGGSNGIGAATARKFVAEGAYVYVVDIDEEGGVKVCQELDGNASFVKCEVTIETHVKGVVDRAMEEKGHLDIMMNNAGAMLGMKHAARVMIPRNSGSILFNCSVLGLMKTDNAFHGYMASKNALLGFDEEWCSAVGKGRNIVVDTTGGSDIDNGAIDIVVATGGVAGFIGGIFNRIGAIGVVLGAANIIKGEDIVAGGSWLKLGTERI